MENEINAQGGMQLQGHMKIKGGRENNLNNISVEIPKFKLVVVTGSSGSGKSTLAMDTMQRECKRQYMESISCPEQTRARK